jgi:hypothetical protein
MDSIGMLDTVAFVHPINDVTRSPIIKLADPYYERGRTITCIMLNKVFRSVKRGVIIIP